MNIGIYSAIKIFCPASSQIIGWHEFFYGGRFIFGLTKGFLP